MNRYAKCFFALWLAALAAAPCPVALAQDAAAAGQQQAAGADPAARLSRFLGNIEVFNSLFPQEKVYLHLDNTAYFRGETLWFSAYVVRADRPALTDMSRVLYVELLDPTGEVVATRKVRLSGGRGNGSFKLDRVLTAGYYEVRAYTRYMLNWDAAWAFSRVIPVFEKPEREGDYSHPTIYEPDHRKRMPSARAADSTAARGVGVAFYPEGGRLTAGLPSRVAFSVSSDGAPLDCECLLTLADGRRQQVRTLREGRGVFDYTPAATPATLTVTDAGGRRHDFNLPAAQAEGCALSVSAVEGSHVGVTVSRTPGYTEPLALVLMSGGNIDAADILQGSERTARRRFARADMMAGVNQLALIDSQGRIVAERMVFVCPAGGADSIGFTARGALSPCGKLTFEARTEPGATFSVAVRDRAAEVNGQQGNAATWLLLSSDLRGYINRPEYYLEADDAEHRRAADLLMMVQGWRRYDVEQMEGGREFRRTHPIEDRLYLFGQLKQASRRNKPAGVNLTATLYNRAGESMRGRAVTDSAGLYAFSLPDCEGEWTLLLNTRGADGKAKKYRVCIDRNFSPAPRPLAQQETQPIPTAAAPSPEVEANFADTADITKLAGMEDRLHVIKEVNVRGKRLFENARAGWENEQRGAFKAYLRYDCDRAADELYDAGRETPTIFEWLARKNPFFGAESQDPGELATLAAEGNTVAGAAESLPTTMLSAEASAEADAAEKEEGIDKRGFMTREGMAYKNRPVVWVLNNTFYMGTSTRGVRTKDIEYIRENSAEEMPLWLDEYKSVYISEDENVWRSYVEAPALAAYSPVTVFLYSHHEFPAKQKGLRHTHFDGYSHVETFQMPDYSLMPPAPDHRRTLYWNPAVKADKDGRATIELYNNSSCRQISISAEGITYDGRALVYGRP